MNDPQGNPSADDYEGGDDPVVPPTHVLPADHGHHGGEATNNQHSGDEDHSEPSYPGFQLFPFIRREAIGWDRAIELIFAGVIVLFSWLQYESSQETSKQIQAIVDASREIRTAAWTFSGASQGINNAGWSAVGRLNDQATQLGTTAKQTGRLASDTETANSNIVLADRPWMGGVLQSVADFEVDKKPSFTIVFINSGKRPAKVTSSGYSEGFYRFFPIDPNSQYASEGEEPSTNIIVPNGSVIMSVPAGAINSEQWRLAHIPTPPLIYYVFAKVEYTDLRTNEAHWTHICFRFYPKFKSDKDWGFRNCNEYNDVDSNP